jgi:hypothetical protein
MAPHKHRCLWSDCALKILNVYAISAAHCDNTRPRRLQNIGDSCFLANFNQVSRRHHNFAAGYERAGHQ